jgi:hypothetical protein
MVEIDAGEPVSMRRPDIATTVAVVLAADAVFALVIAVLGVPFLLFVFGDEDGTWHRLWPYAAGWVVAVAFAAVATASAVRFAGFGEYPIRLLGSMTAVGMAVAVGVVAPVAVRTAPGWIVVCLPIAVANLATAWALISPARAGAVAQRLAGGGPERDEFPDPDPPAADAEPGEDSPGPPYEPAAAADVVSTRETSTCACGHGRAGRPGRPHRAAAGPDRPPCDPCPGCGCHHGHAGRGPSPRRVSPK